MHNKSTLAVIPHRQMFWKYCQQSLDRRVYTGNHCFCSCVPMEVGFRSTIPESQASESNLGHKSSRVLLDIYTTPIRIFLGSGLDSERSSKLTCASMLKRYQDGWPAMLTKPGVYNRGHHAQVRCIRELLKYVFYVKLCISLCAYVCWVSVVSWKGLDPLELDF